MEREEIIDVLEKTGAFVSGHFVLAAGNHAKDYLNKDAVYPDTEEISKLAEGIATKFEHDKIEVVIGPEKGGIIISQWVAHHLTILNKRKVYSVYAEKIINGTGVTKEFEIKRNYDQLVKNRRALVVEDILTTGGSVKKVVELIRSIGGNVVGLGALCNRGKVTAHDVGDVPKFFALLNIELATWDPGHCPLCDNKVPININLGKGKKYLEDNPEKAKWK